MGGDYLDKVLIVSYNEKAKDTLCQLLKEYRNIQIITTSSASKARRYVANNEVGIAIINTPLKEETGTQLSLDFARLNIGTILIVKNEMVEEISADVDFAGVLVLQKPIIKPMFYQAFKMQLALKNRLLNLKKENDKLRNKIEEIKTVDRAKLVLIEHENLTEEEAHKFIEKQAMNDRISRYLVAKEILIKYNII